MAENPGIKTRVILVRFKSEEQSVGKEELELIKNLRSALTSLQVNS